MKPGDQVDDFALQDETGATRRLSELLQNGPVALFFYPIAASGGCTQEACHFRDLAADFAAVGAQPVGISGDPVGRQHAFASTHSLGYPLLSDTGHKVAKALAPTAGSCRAGCTPGGSRSSSGRTGGSWTRSPARRSSTSTPTRP
jgi:peroxiredoxin Q/BCP